MEKYLDAGHGEPWLASPAVAGIVIEELARLSLAGVSVPHYTILPNHWHALLAPSPECTLSLSEAMRLIKGRIARRINATLGRHGTLWQREWFDRWMRSENEWERCVDYIHENPVKAGLSRTWQEHPSTK